MWHLVAIVLSLACTSCADTVVLEGEMTGIDCQMRAGREPDQVERERHARGFIEIVDRPDQPTFRIPPCAEIFNVEIAHRKGLGRIVFLLADFGPDLNPAVEGGAQKRKTPLRMASCFMRRFAGRMVS
jgi:hypothetical protein